MQWTRGANLKLAEDPNIDTIVVAADWTGYFTALDPAEIWTYYYEHHGIRDNLRGQLGSKATDEALAGFERMISRFVALGKNVFIILPSPAGKNLFADQNGSSAPRQISASTSANPMFLRRDT